VRYRDALDEFKLELGLPPNIPLIPDRRIAQRIGAVYDSLDRWIQSPNRDPADLPSLVGKLPKVGDVSIAGRSVLSAGSDSSQSLESFLQSATRLAAKLRPEVPNARPAALDHDLRDFAIRRQIRQLQQTQEAYEIAAQRLALAYREGDRLFDQLNSPPSAAEMPKAAEKVQAVGSKIETNSAEISNIERHLVDEWVRSQTLRLSLYRELGFLPYDDWPSFHRSFVTGEKGVVKVVQTGDR
jgi:hypothetical protein